MNLGDESLGSIGRSTAIRAVHGTLAPVERRAAAADRPGDSPRALVNDQGIATLVTSTSQSTSSSDEVDLVEHPRPADADEHTLVQPIEIGHLRLDLRRRAVHLFTRIDLLTATEASENLRTSMAHFTRAHVQPITVIGLQCVADIHQRCVVWQHDLPIGVCPLGAFG
jgi:hypothetical protein